MSDVVIWGAGGHARVVVDIIRLNGKDEVIGFIDDVSPQRRGEPFLGSTVLGGQELLEEVKSQGISKAIVAVGDCGARLRISQLLEFHGFELVQAYTPVPLWPTTHC